MMSMMNPTMNLTPSGSSSLLLQSQSQQPQSATMSFQPSFSAPNTTLNTMPASLASSAATLEKAFQQVQQQHQSSMIKDQGNDLDDEEDIDDEEKMSSEGSNGSSSTQNQMTSGGKKESSGGSGRISLFNLKDQQQEVVNWLRENYEVDEEISLARDAIYGHYGDFCQSRGVEKMGTASFGKMIRLVFTDVKTRRLGVRGQSKYHYQGIKIKGSSPLAVKESQQRILTPQAKRVKLEKNVSVGPSVGRAVPEAAQPPIYQSFNLSLTLSLPSWNGSPELLGLSQLYQDHCLAILNLIRQGEFTKLNVELSNLITSFWSSLSEPDINAVQSHDFIDFIHHCDVILYSIIIKTMLPDLLRDIPLVVTQSIRNFGKGVVQLFQNALSQYVPAKVYAMKMEVVKAFAQIIKRSTSLNHLSQAARAVWQNEAQVNQMREDWILIDFKTVHEQAMFACGCDETLLLIVEKQFENCLHRRYPIEEWPVFLEKLTQHSIPLTSSPAEFRFVTKQFLLKWSFYCSTLIRDLTLRSATSFGSFHLIRLYYEEFLHLLVDRQYTVMKRQELESKFPVNFFSVIHPSMAILLDHTPYFKSGSPSPQTHFRMPQMPEPLPVETALSQAPVQNDYPLAARGLHHNPYPTHFQPQFNFMMPALHPPANNLPGHAIEHEVKNLLSNFRDDLYKKHKMDGLQ